MRLSTSFHRWTVGRLVARQRRIEAKQRRTEWQLRRAYDRLVETEAGRENSRP